jgi:RNA polymerase sigma factor (sigma-70 family)
LLVTAAVMETLVQQIAAARNGDMDAYGLIVQRFRDMAYACAYAVLGDFHLAEDAAQEAFVEAYRKLADLREPRAFPGWFRKVVLKHCDRLTRRARVLTVPLELAATTASSEPAPDERAEEAERQRTVLGALQSLPAPQRLATTLFYMNGYSQDEVADFLEVPVTTVKKRLHDSRRKLKETLMNKDNTAALTQQTLKQHLPAPDFTQKVLDRMRALSGQWQQDGEILSGMYGGKRTEFTSQWEGRLVTCESWPGDAVVVEFDALAMSGLDGAHIQTFFFPRPTSEECAHSGEEVYEFLVETSSFGKYHWSQIKQQMFCPKWSRHSQRMPADGDFCGVFNHWYHVKAERIGQMLRLWVDGVPVYERKADAPPPAEVWPVLGADISHNRFRQLTIYRPDDAYIRQYRRPVSGVFRPYTIEQTVLAKYPATVVKTAAIKLGARNVEQGIREWRGDKNEFVTVAATIGRRSCRRTDLTAKDEAGEYFGFRVDDLGWNRFNEVYLDLDYYDQGAGAIAAIYNTWYYRDTPGEDLPLTDTRQWRTHTTRLREVAFRDLGRRGSNILLTPLRTGGQDLHVSGVRLREVVRPAVAYEELLALYAREARRHHGAWPEPHYRYAMYRVLKHNLKRHAEAQTILRELIEQHPGSECLDAHHQMQVRR